MVNFKSLNDSELSNIVGGGKGGWLSFGIGVVKNWNGEVSSFKRGYSGKNY